jgi:hypothetical protein
VKTGHQLELTVFLYVGVVMSFPLNPGQVVENLKSDLGGAVEQTYVDVGASPSTGGLQSVVVTFAAASATTQGDYFTFEQPDEDVLAVWLNIDNNDTAPSGAVYTAADNPVEVDIAGADTAAQVAGKVKTAIEADLDFADVTIVDNLDGSLTLTYDLLGAYAEAGVYNADDSGAGSVVASTVLGSAAGLQNKYFTVYDDADAAHHVWMNVNGEGVDPDPGSSTGVEVAVAAGLSASALATALAAGVETIDSGYFSASGDGQRVVISASAEDEIVDVAVGDSGFTVAVQSQGASEKLAPAGSPASISNNPSAF